MARTVGVQEERYEVPQWMFLQWELLQQRSVRGMLSGIRIDVSSDNK